MSGPERKPGARPRARAPRTGHPFERALGVAAEDEETTTAQPEPEPATVTPPAQAPAQPYDPQVAIGGRGPESVRKRLKLWCVGNGEPMDKVLVRAITEFLDRNGG